MNINLVYSNYVQYVDTASSSVASQPLGFDASGLAWVSESTASAVPDAQDVATVGAAGTAFVMPGGKSPALPQGANPRGGELRSPDSSPEEPGPPAAITAGVVPLDVLLCDPELPAHGVGSGVEQVAELVPIDESSLALVATLYSLPSESPSEPSDGADPSGEPSGAVPSSASPQRWAAFVMGLDEAFEQSGDACAKNFCEVARSDAEAAVDVPGELLEWHRPILPTPAGTPREPRAGWTAPADIQAVANPPPPYQEPDPDRPVASRSARNDEPVGRPSPEFDSPHDAREGQPQIQAVGATACAASGSVLIAGWLWARRRSRRGRDRRSIDREGPNRGRTGAFEEVP
jgi:hypothetical protein